MALESIDEYTWEMRPGPIDVHTHPRVMDTRIQDINRHDLINEWVWEGKAGLAVVS